jgi:hypothetical protein
VTPTLQVQRLGHVNVFAYGYEAVLPYFRDVFGARIFAEWEEPGHGGKNALWLVGGTCFELFTPTSPAKAIGKWLARQGPGWHSMEWTIPSLDDCRETLAEHHIRISDSDPGNYVFTHPRDLHGLCLELTPHHFEKDDRDLPGWTPSYWTDEHPLGIVGKAKVKLASRNPEKAAGDVAALVGRDTYQTVSMPTNTIAHGIEFADHHVEFVGSQTGSGSDQVGSFLATRGERIFRVELGIRSLEQARAYLAGLNVRFTQWGAESLLLEPEALRGTPIELAVR